MKDLIRRWREWRFKRGSYGTTILLPRSAHDLVFDYPPEAEVVKMLDRVVAPRALHNWYKLGTGLRYGRIKPELLEWLEEYGPYEVKLVSATNLPMSEFFAGVAQNIHKRLQIRLCHEESVALFKLTWL